ncbi:cupin [Fictibacillus aquaticus]|uniref:Cupin n=1 Tax=Fictibacillus aquaticus TaxID=2021314 RepID=A0A235F7F3_9BACL|nr:cupin [Fictibacillus aquaticus]OYD57271.1 cupin [Fictibacillus aquaticus]
MEIYRFDKKAGKKITHFESDFIMSRIMMTSKPAHIGCMHLEENGVIGYHDAVVPQLLLIVEGEGWVCGEDEERVHVQTGDAVFWTKGEGHETTTKKGLTAIVIESEELNPSNFMPLRDTF